MNQGLIYMRLTCDEQRQFCLAWFFLPQTATAFHTHSKQMKIYSNLRTVETALLQQK